MAGQRQSVRTVRLMTTFTSGISKSTGIASGLGETTAGTGAVAATGALSVAAAALVEGTGLEKSGILGTIPIFLIMCNA